MEFKTGDVVLWKEKGINVTIDRVFKTTVTAVWFHGGELCRGAFRKSDLTTGG